ncbi:hypothetical protein BV20DRAFT_1120766 [Pilatotrama ljubarskyi]|nr:hypothetical protein BV20DRAFT_1120766 [Pilatotrama ljubarskyi]
MSRRQCLSQTSTVAAPEHLHLLRTRWHWRKALEDLQLGIVLQPTRTSYHYSRISSLRPLTRPSNEFASSRTSSIFFIFATLAGLGLQPVYKHQTHNVTWDVSDAPVNITNEIARITLRKGGLPTPLILADGFDIRLGRIEVQVPWVVQGSD